MTDLVDPTIQTFLSSVLRPILENYHLLKNPALSKINKISTGDATMYNTKDVAINILYSLNNLHSPIPPPFFAFCFNSLFSLPLTWWNL
jgi:hypothetical protein